jgi:hypothetical protein
VRRGEARRPRVWFAARHPGSAGAPPGSTTRPRQELADDRQVYDPRVQTQAPNVTLTSVRCRGSGALTAKARPDADKSPLWRADRRPPCPATDTDTKRFALFGAPTPSGDPCSATSWRGEKRSKVRTRKRRGTIGFGCPQPISEARAVSRSRSCVSSRVGNFGSICSSRSTTAAETTSRVNHLWSAGTTYQGASPVAVPRIISS